MIPKSGNRFSDKIMRNRDVNDDDHASTPPLPIARGLRGRCPRCGEGKLFQGFLTLRPRCEKCGLDYRFADAGDGPAVFVILLGGAIVVFAALITEVVYQPPYWVHAALWLPLILLGDARCRCG